MVCSMSNDLEGIKLVRMADLQVRQLTPQVVNAARILVARPTSKVALENMEVYKDAWQKNVRLLTDAVDDIITINDFLAVSENHILEDINRCVLALRERDVETLDRTAGAIRGRVSRVCNIVSAEMDNYEPCDYTNKVLENVITLRDQIIVNFARSVDYAINALVAQPLKDTDENDFIDASRLVYDGVRDVRNAVLLIRDPNYEVSDSDIDEADGEEEIVQVPEDVYEVEPKPDEFKHLTTEQRVEIERHLEIFKEEKRNFEREVLKWDDKGNDIIVLAKQMCVIMMEMTDFTRGRGPLKTTMDIINAAKKISECGAKLDKLARIIADEVFLFFWFIFFLANFFFLFLLKCPESQSKRDLDAYLKPIPLFCNQLNIASKVKENVIDVSGEPIIQGVCFFKFLLTN
jgi:catenin alpha